MIAGYLLEQEKNSWQHLLIFRAKTNKIKMNT